MCGAVLAVSSCATDSTTSPTPVVTPVPTTVAVAVSGTVVNADAQRLLGVTFEGRTSMRKGASGTTPAGMYDDATGALYPAVAPLWNTFPLTGMRYPGNAVQQRWDWKGTIGSVASRPLQQLATGSPTQRVVFGFDEFMAMAAARGVAAADVQIMVVIYPTASAPDAAVSAADWVEYANAPNNGSNIRGGTDWAAVRAANGHPAPYGIRIWNIGNEPWIAAEYNFNPTPYIPVALLFIDAMREADPTIRVTIPVLGTATSSWNAGILASTALTSRVWGLSPHYFYSDAGTSVTIAQAETGLRAVTAQAAAKSLTVVIGDHAHGIANTSSSTEADLAMQWQGAITTASFLVMASQVPNVDRANFWIYAMPTAVWHPFRVNADGSYTKMAVAALYELLQPTLLAESLATTVTESSTGSLRVRAAGFRSADGRRMSLVVVNPDRILDHALSASPLTGFSLTQARLLTAAALDADNFSASGATPLAGGGWALPRSSVLVLEYGN